MKICHESLIIAEINKDYYFNNIIKKNKSKKKQIILLNTEVPIANFLTKISTRYNKNYTKIPTFTIARDGKIFQHYNPTFSSELFTDPNINKQSITIALENVGWLNYNKATNKYIDWRDDIYDGEVINKPWRGKKLWADYTDTQFFVLIKLIDYLCIEHSIEKYFIGNNVIIKNPIAFKGILNRSNYFKNYYDLTPAFDFEKLTENIN